MHIRPAHNSDIEALQDIEKTVFPSDRLSARQMRYHVKSDRAIFLVGCSEMNAEAGGYVLFFLRNNSLSSRLYSIAVSPRLQGQGYARNLIMEAESLLTAKGIKTLTLEVDRNDDKTVEFYKRLGFIIHDTIAGYYEDGRDAHKMRKTLV